jgi:hypothetical protein
VPVAVGAVAVVDDHSGTNGHNGRNGNGHTAEPVWLQRLKAGAFEDD